jgi:hypothetical protein
MEVNGLYARINTPEALSGDCLHKLPPHCLRPTYAVDEYPACPANWMHGSSKASSYFVPVQVGRGMWFDFTMNAGNRYDIAVVISVQGVNPVTGKKVTELNLEQYRDNCPIHNKPFQQDRYCEECGYKWPGQNYLATTTGYTLWIDGFRNEKGEVRQYIITEDIARGIAAQVVGKDRVWAIGFAFYLSKEPRPKIVHTSEIHTSGFSSVMDFGGYESLKADSSFDDEYGASADMLMDDGLHGAQGPCGPVGPCGAEDKGTYASLMNMSTVKCSTSMSSSRSMSKVLRSAPVSGQKVKPAVQKKVLEIGAGSRIDQEIGADPNPIDYWQAEPAGMIYVNYVDEQTANDIINAGRREDKEDGALHGLKVGN